MEPLGDIVGNTDVSSVHNEDSTSYNENITEKDDIISTDGSMDDIPDYYIFKIYLFFIAWETFDLANEQFDIRPIGDSKKANTYTQSLTRKKERDSKYKEINPDTSTVHEFSTDQRISIEQLNAQK